MKIERGSAKGIVYADVRLGNDARPELEEIKVAALVERVRYTCAFPSMWPYNCDYLKSSPARYRRPTEEDATWFPMSVPSRSLYWGGNAGRGPWCLVNQVLLGAIPMEDMDLIIEPSQQKVTVNPASRTSPCRWPRVTG